jgi:hypothetical protein
MRSPTEERRKDCHNQWKRKRRKPQHRFYPWVLLHIRFQSGLITQALDLANFCLPSISLPQPGDGRSAENDFSTVAPGVGRVATDAVEIVSEHPLGPYLPVAKARSRA